jgi:hypothetical protein
MASPSGLSVAFAGQDVHSRRVSAAVLNELEEPRPPGGWNTLERFASSYQRSTAFSPLEFASPGTSFGGPQHHHRGRIPSFSDEGDSALVDEEEDSALLRGRRTVRSRLSHDSLATEPVEGGEDHFAEFRGLVIPKDTDFYGTIRRGSRRPSILSEHGAADLLIKEVEDEAGNIIEVVVGQVTLS